MILPIVGYGAAVLRNRSVCIQRDYAELNALIDNMWETLYNADGCGLAAPQVNKAVRVFVIDDNNGTKQCFINPAILHYGNEMWEDEEGCLSIPGLSARIKRPWEITIHYADSNFKEHTKTFTGITARMIQHEYDHLEGILYIDHLSSLEKKLWKTRLEKVRKGKINRRYPMI